MSIQTTRISRQRTLATADQLSTRDREIVAALGTAKLMTGEQLERLTFSDLPTSTRSRTRRRVLARLVQLRLVATLGRQIGGVRAGSHGLIYSLDSAGQMLVAIWRETNRERRTRRPRTPGLPFLAHSLAVSEAFVSLTCMAREGAFALSLFLTEPDCWWPDGNGGRLRPDAFVLAENDRIESAWWLEIDQGTENIARIQAKLAAYRLFAERGQAAGPSGLMPQILFAANEAKRVQAIAQTIEEYGHTSRARAVLQVDISSTIHAELEA